MKETFQPHCIEEVNRSQSQSQNEDLNCGKGGTRRISCRVGLDSIETDTEKGMTIVRDGQAYGATCVLFDTFERR